MDPGKNICFQYVLNNSLSFTTQTVFFYKLFFYSGSKKKIGFNPDEKLEVIDVDSQLSCEYKSDTTSVLVDDDNDSKCDTEECHVESATEDDENSNEESLESDGDVTEETDDSVDTSDASVVESKEESEDEIENESEDESDDGHYLDDPNKEEYGAIVETNANPDFDGMVDMILHKKVTTAHVTSPSGRKSVYDIGKADVREKLRRIFDKRTGHGQDYTWVL